MNTENEGGGKLKGRLGLAFLRRGDKDWGDS